jgi:hypothetical protein
VKHNRNNAVRENISESSFNISIQRSHSWQVIRSITNIPPSQDESIRLDTIEPYEVKINGEKVILLDTPGLDLQHPPNCVFKMIAGWLKQEAR